MGQLISQYTGAYLTGFALSLLISVIVIGFSILIGTFAAIGRTSRHRAFRIMTAFYVAVFRGLPPILTRTWSILASSFAESADVPLLSWLLRPLDNRIVAAVVGFMLSSGAYSTEIIRAGIASVKKEQIDAARSIGMKYGLAFRRIIAPQAFRTAFPPLSNEYITVLKATSLASVIGVVELMRTAQMVGNQTFQMYSPIQWPEFTTWLFVAVLQSTFARIESGLLRARAKPTAIHSVASDTSHRSRCS